MLERLPDMTRPFRTCEGLSAHALTCPHMSGPVCTCQDMSAHVSTCPHMSGHVRTCQDLSAHARRTCQPVRAWVRQSVSARLSQATSEFTQEKLSSLHFEKSTIGRLQNTKNQCQWLNIKWRNGQNLRKNAGQAGKKTEGFGTKTAQFSLKFSRF